jgi:hypothetical protein
MNQFPAMKGKRWDLERPERRLKDFADRHGLLLLQPVSTFRAVSKEKTLFFGNVGHMTNVGHEFTAEVIAEFLSNQNLLPKLYQHPLEDGPTN